VKLLLVLRGRKYKLQQSLEVGGKLAEAPTTNASTWGKGILALSGLHFDKLAAFKIVEL